MLLTPSSGRTGKRHLLTLAVALAGGAAAAVAATAYLAPIGRVEAEIAPVSNPAFLVRALGSENTATARVATRSFPSGVVVGASADDAFTSTWGAARLGLRLEGAGSASWRSHDGGLTRSTPFGTQTVLLGVPSSEEFLTVRRHTGQKTWRWRIATGAGQRLVRAGNELALVDRDGGLGLTVAAPAILDARGRRTGPAGLRWGLEQANGARFLTLDLDDSALPLPYVIDPAVTFARHSKAATSAGTSLALGAPAGAVAGNTMVAFVALKNTNTPTAPAGWTAFGTATTQSGTVLRTYWKRFAAGDPTYTWSWTTSSDAVGTIIELSDARTTGTPLDQISTNSASSALPATTALTTAESNESVLSFFIGNGTTGSDSANVIDSITGHTTIFSSFRSNSVPASRVGSAAGYAQQAAPGTSAAPTAHSEGNAVRGWIARLVSVRTNDTVAPGTSITANRRRRRTRRTRPLASRAQMTRWGAHRLVRVPARRRRLHDVHVPDDVCRPADNGLSHVRRARARLPGERRRHPRDVHVVDRRHRADDEHRLEPRRSLEQRQRDVRLQRE